MKDVTITALVICKNEAYTVFNSLASLESTVDKYLVLDNGSKDGTIEEILRAKNYLGLDLDLYIRPRMNFIDARNMLNDLVTTDWVIISDADFIFQTNGPDNIEQIKPILANTQSPTVYSVPLISLDGDFHHHAQPLMMNPPKYVYCKKHAKRFMLSRRFPKLLHTGDIKPLEFTPIYHLRGLKNDDKLFIRRHWTNWRVAEHPKYANFPTVESYIQSMFKDVDKAKAKFIDEYMKKLEKFEPNQVGSYYPELVKLMMHNSKYKVLYDGDKIIGRDQRYE